MQVKVNSNLFEIDDDHRLISLLKKLSLHEKGGMAVAVNAEVVSKKNWNQCVLNENDEVLIIEAAQGG